MKKNIGRVLLLFLILFAPLARVSAAEQEINIYLYYDYTDCVFIIHWENTEQPAKIRLQSPDGQEIIATEENTDFGNGRAMVSVGNAPSGYWTVFVEGRNLGIINISGGSRHKLAEQENAIQSFSANVEGDRIKFAWEVVAETDTVNVSIQAVKGEGIREQSLYSDYSARKNGTAEVFTEELQTGLYTFRLEVHDGSAQYMLSTEEAVYIKSQNAPEKLEDIRVGSIDGKLYATWYARLDASYLVTLYDYETLAVIREESAYTNFYEITLPDGTERAKISISAVENGVYGDFDVYEIIHTTPSGTITFPEIDITKEGIFPVYADCPAGTSAGVYLDGVLLMEDMEAGSYDLSLSEGTHEIVAYIKDGNGNMRSFIKQVTVDRTPPLINLNTGDETRTAFDSFILEGNTEPNATVTINGVEQELSGSTFMAKVALREGVNQISVTAYDLAGNKSVKTITVERTVSSDSSWTIFILPGIAFVLLSIWYIYLNRKPGEVTPGGPENKKPEENKASKENKAPKGDKGSKENKASGENKASKEKRKPGENKESKEGQPK